MKKAVLAFVFFIAIVVASIAGFLASSSPDGLERVAARLGLAKRAVHSSAIMAGYRFPWIAKPSVSTVAAGIFGIVLIYFIFRSISKVRHVGQFLKDLLGPSQR